MAWLAFWLLLLLFALVVAAAAARDGDGRVEYKVDAGWPKGMPANATRFTAAATTTTTTAAEGTAVLEVGTGRSEPQALALIAQRGLDFPEPILVFDLQSGELLNAWGSKHIASTPDGGWGVHGMNVQRPGASGSAPLVWITDVIDHTVKVFHINGTLVSITGTAGQQGNGTAPLQFGNVADVSFGTQSRAPFVFVSDGDGGINNRVMALHQHSLSLAWIRGAAAGTRPLQFNSPHTVMYHPPSSTVLVGDRGNKRVQQLSPDGAFLDQWTCVRPGTVWGLRWIPSINAIALADGDSQTLTFYDASNVTASGLGPCRALQQISIPKATCNTPHELGVDNKTGDLLLTCVNNPGSGFLKFTLQH